MIRYQNHKETSLDIPLRDGKYIHAILRGELEQDRPVVVMMHGRPGSANELLQYLGAHYISEHDITTLRLSMYDFGSQYRDLLDCTLDTHVEDFETVVQYLRDKGLNNIFALGHSYGGITILKSQVELEGAILWDPSHGLAWQSDDPGFNSADFPEEQLGEVIVGTGGHGYIRSKEQADYDNNLGDTTSLVDGKSYPMKFILASAGPLATYARRYYEERTDQSHSLKSKLPIISLKIMTRSSRSYFLRP